VCVILSMHEYVYVSECLSVSGCQVVFPMSSIEYPGTRVIGHFFNYSSTRVIGSSIEY